ncbi:MAG: hypothetical protein Q7S16_02690 [bacterium]|nr:hypothetical protein [bacterium]
MSNEVVLDIETQNTFQDIGSRDTDQLKIFISNLINKATRQLSKS